MGQNARSARRENKTVGRKSREKKSSIKIVPKPKKGSGGKNG